jgi:hypothetical protein
MKLHSRPPQPPEPRRASEKALTARDFWRGMRNWSRRRGSRGFCRHERLIDIVKPSDILAL